MEPTVNVNEVSRISTGTVIRGEIDSPGDLRIDGTFEGKIVSRGRVVIGKDAVVSGDIFCINMDFSGKMTGSIYVKDTLSLKDNCSVSGDIHVRKLAVELGSHFDGNCKMIKEEEFEKLLETVVSRKGGNSTNVKPVIPGTSIAAGGTSITN